MASARTLDEAFAALIDGIVDALGALGNPEVFAEMVRIYTRHAASRALADQPHHLMRAVAARFVEAHSSKRLRSGLDPATATHLFLTSVFGYLSLPADVDDARRELRTLTWLYLGDGPGGSDAKDPGR